MKRTALSKKTRFDVFKRDSFTCQYCGAHPPSVILHVDHIEAVAHGGQNDSDNLVTACEACNLGKGARKLSAIPEALAGKAARIAEAEEQLAGWTAVLQAKRERLDDEAWQVVEALTGQTEIRRDHLQSIKRFIERLGVSALLDSAEIARARTLWSEAKTFKYFCGVCWGKIREADGES